MADTGICHERRKMVYFGEVDFQIPPTKYSENIFSTNLTPKVLNIDTLIPVSSAPFTVTNFLNGTKNQELKILGDGFLTIANNANIKTNTGGNKLLANNKVYVFYFINSIWYEHV